MTCSASRDAKLQYYDSLEKLVFTDSYSGYYTSYAPSSSTPSFSKPPGSVIK